MFCPELQWAGPSPEQVLKARKDMIERELKADSCLVVLRARGGFGFGQAGRKTKQSSLRPQGTNITIPS